MNMPPVNPDNSSLPLMVTFNLDVNRWNQTNIHSRYQIYILQQLWEHGDGRHGAGSYDEIKPSVEGQQVKTTTSHHILTIIWSSNFLYIWRSTQAAVQQHPGGPVPERCRPRKARTSLASYNKVVIFNTFQSTHPLDHLLMFSFSFNTAKTGKIVTEDGSDRLAVLKESGESWN